MTLRAVDLCCGAGGWAVAARGLPIRIVAALDWWPRALETHQLNHPGIPVVRADLSRGVPLRTEGVDLVLGGIPCQWLSTMRNKALQNAPKPEEVERERRLLDSILSWIGQAKPRWWVLEDIPAILRELPPLTPFQMLNARDFSGQNRKRAYVGWSVRPRPTNGAALNAGAYLRRGPYRVGDGARRRVTSRRVFGRDTIYPIERDRKIPCVLGAGGRHDKYRAVMDPGIPGGRRQVEWQEWAAAQGFPDDYVFVGNQMDTNRMVADAVQVDTARAILAAICDESETRRTSKVGPA